MTTLQYVNEIVPSETRTTAITVFTAFSTGVGGFVGNMGGGFILGRSNIFYLFKILSLLCIVSLMIGLVLKGIDRKDRIKS
jgi:MFS family permease